MRLSRSGGAIDVFDHLAGGWLASRKGRRPVEVRVLIWKDGNRKRDERVLIERVIEST